MLGCLEEVRCHCRRGVGGYCTTNRISSRTLAEAHARNMERTATEQALIDERSTKPARPGIDDTSTPFWMRASVTLKLVGSNEFAQMLVTSAPCRAAVEAFIVDGGRNECSAESVSLRKRYSKC
jgi:hypothetical protein